MSAWLLVKKNGCVCEHIALEENDSPPRVARISMKTKVCVKRNVSYKRAIVERV